MTNAIQKQNQATAIEQLVISGDLARLSPDQRVAYYNQVCESLQLNPFTKPFDYIKLNGKLTLYPKKDAADQLRKIHGISFGRPTLDFQDDVLIVTMDATDRTGRTDSDVGVVNIKGKVGDNKANAIMKAITKAKRRTTLSIAGLGWTDETEWETVPQAVPIVVTDDGEIIDTTFTATNGANGNGASPQPETTPADRSTSEQHAAAEAVNVADAKPDASGVPADDNPFHDEPPAEEEPPAQPDDKCAKLIAWAQGIARDGKIASDASYRLLAGKLDAITDHGHSVALATLCGWPANSEDKPSQKLVSKLIDAISETTAKMDGRTKVKDADGKVVYVENPNYRQDVVDCLAAIAKQASVGGTK